MKKFDVIVVGGGASGSFLAVKLAQKGVKVCVIDSNNVPAKKLLVTGNGKCNIMNSGVKSEFFNQDIDKFLEKFDFSQTKHFFECMGVHIYTDENSRCYPISNSAKSVQFAFENQFAKNQIAFFGGETFLNFKKSLSGFVVTTNQAEYECKNLVIATREIPSCDFGVQIVPVVKSLVALKTVQNTKMIDGVRCENVCVSIKQGGKVIAHENGEILFKDHGISGICVFNLSSFFARNKSFSGKVCVDFLPSLTNEQLFVLLKENQKIYGKTRILTTILHEKLEKFIISHLSNDFTIEQLIHALHNFEFDICGCYDNNQVLSGGVNLNSLTDSLENKNIPNQYFCGEVCDVDALCGGYNLQWAWTSASIVADDILHKLGK